MTLEQIEDLQIDDVRILLIQRVLADGIANLPQGEFPFLDFEPLTLHPNLSMPTDASLNVELDKYKEELRIEEETRLAEEARQNNLRGRTKDLLDADIHVYFHNIGSNVSNPAALFRDLIIDKDKDSEIRQLLLDLEEAKRVHEDSLVAQQEINELDAMRADRDKLLAATDFTQLPDAPLNTAEKTEYREYRDYLRNLPELYANSQVLEAVAMEFSEWKLNKPVY